MTETEIKQMLAQGERLTLECKKGKGADLNDVELAANCLLNVLFIGRHPQGFDKDYKKLLK